MAEIPNYLRAPITGRDADLLALYYNYRDPAAMAESIPEDAQVLDVGAGHSKLGLTIAQSRPDITWHNFDYAYSPDFIEEANTLAPNVVYASGDVLELTKHYKPESMDRIYSYWLLPHLSVEGPEIVAQAAEQLYEVGKDQSTLALGPDCNLLRFGSTREWQKSSELPVDVFSEEVCQAIALRGAFRFMVHSVNMREKKLVTDRSDIAAINKTHTPTKKRLVTMGRTFADTAGLYASLAQYPMQKAYFRAMIALEGSTDEV